MLGTVWPCSIRETYKRFRPVRSSMSPCVRSFCKRRARNRCAIIVLLFFITRQKAILEWDLACVRRRRRVARWEESLEFAVRGGLVQSDAAGGDVGFEIVFTLNGRAAEAAEHGDLADVIEGVGDGALE